MALQSVKVFQLKRSQFFLHPSGSHESPDHITVVEIVLDFSVDTSISIQWNALLRLRDVSPRTLFIDLSNTDSGISIIQAQTSNPPSGVTIAGRVQGWLPLMFEEPLNLTVEFAGGAQQPSILLRFVDVIVPGPVWSTNTQSPFGPSQVWTVVPRSLTVDPFTDAVGATLVWTHATRTLTPGPTQGGAIQKQQIFTASGTFTPSANLLAEGGWVTVTIVGGGGGGGGCTGNTSFAGGGGGGGQWVQQMVQCGGPMTVTIGGGGSAGTIGGANGGAGGNTTFDALLTALGGSGGTTGTPGIDGAGGASGSGNIGGSPLGGGGGAGSAAQLWQTTTLGPFAGGFGIFNLGGGGGSGGNSGTNTTPGPGQSGGGSGGIGGAASPTGTGNAGKANSGGGGGGGGGQGNTPGNTGGVGGSGICIVTWFE